MRFLSVFFFFLNFFFQTRTSVGQGLFHSIPLSCSNPIRVTISATELKLYKIIQSLFTRHKPSASMADLRMAIPGCCGIPALGSRAFGFPQIKAAFCLNLHMEVAEARSGD